MTNNDFYFVRPGVLEDKNFILATFLRGLYYGNDFYNLIPKDVFMNNYKVVAEHLTASPNVTVHIAALKEDPGVILGYAILSKDLKTVHWAFTKTVWRNKGIMKSLIPGDIDTITHFTTTTLKYLRHYPNITFNPFKS
jgi:hypothetical protein